MSQENVELVRRHLEAFISGDYDTAISFTDPYLVLDRTRIGPEEPAFGRSDVDRLIGRFKAAFDGYEYDLAGLRELGAGTVLAVGRERGRGRTSGIPVDQPFAGLFTVIDRRIARITYFQSEAEALEAVGLRALTNLDLVRSISADWQSGDYSSAEWAHPNIEYVIADGPTPGSWTGLAGMAEGFRAFASAWEQYRIEPAEYRELDGERVLVLFHPSGRGKTSGLELGQVGTKTAGLFHIREGKVRKLVFYMDGDRALADLGLAPKAGASST